MNEKERQAYAKGIQEGFDLAEYWAEVSTHDGWLVTSPSVDLELAKQKLQERLVALLATKTEETAFDQKELVLLEEAVDSYRTSLHELSYAFPGAKIPTIQADIVRLTKLKQKLNAVWKSVDKASSTSS